MNATTKIETTRFTPRHNVTDVRAEMKITESDLQCFKNLKKNQWTCVHDYVTEENYMVRKASCDSVGCMCDAVYKEI